VIEEALEEHLADNTSAWLMGSDGAYQRLQPEGEKRVSQLRLLSRMGAAES